MGEGGRERGREVRGRERLTEGKEARDWVYNVWFP